MENIRKQYKNKKLKIIAPTWNHEFELPDGSNSVSDIHEYIEFIIKMHETVTAIASFHACINRINNRLMYKTKDGYKLELQTREIIILIGSTKKINKYQVLK